MRATGAATIVTACPFCTIMLKSAQASAGADAADTNFVDVMTFVSDRMEEPPGSGGVPAVSHEPAWRASRMKRIQAAIIAAAGYPLIAVLGRTLSWRTEGLEHLDQVAAAGQQPIFAFWHGRILPATYYFRRRGIVVITSENFDGEWIARIITRFGYGTARGSTSRGGRRALLQLARDLAAGRPAAFTLDGPRGPARQAQAGAVWLAKASGQPLLPFHMEAERFWTLSSWDATQIPRPFSPRRARGSASRSTSRVRPIRTGSRRPGRSWSSGSARSARARWTSSAAGD